MSTAEEITAQITELGNKIKQAKADKQPKELWDEHLQGMMKAKVRDSSGIGISINLHHCGTG